MWSVYAYTWSGVCPWQWALREGARAIFCYRLDFNMGLFERKKIFFFERGVCIGTKNDRIGKGSFPLPTPKNFFSQLENWLQLVNLSKCLLTEKK